MRIEMQLAERRVHRRFVEVGELHGFQIERKIQVTHDSGNLAAQVCRILVVAHVFQLLALQLVRLA